MKKALRKLIPAMVMLLIAAAFVGTSTYAWFSMNRIVNVSGMNVTTTVSDSLSIAATNSESAYGSSLTQSVSGSLRPVSTIDGVSFFYTDGANNVKGNGAASTATYYAYSESAALQNDAAGKTNYCADFQTKYAVTGTITTSNVVYGYVDYVFYIKATNVTGAAEDLKLTTLNLVYHDTTLQTPADVALDTDEKAWRVAVFEQDAADTGALSATDDLRAIIGRPSAAYFTTGKAVAATTGESILDDVSEYAADNTWAVCSVAAGETEYHKITVRLWIEGEDTTCNNGTFAGQVDNYKLSLAFALGGIEPTVYQIASIVA